MSMNKSLQILNPKKMVNKQYPLGGRLSIPMIVLKNVTIVQIDDMGAKTPRDPKKNVFFWIPAKRNKVDVATKSKADKSLASFQEALRATLIMGQLFSLLPVSGILSKNGADVRFNKKSLKCVYAVLSFIGQIYMASMCAYELFVLVTIKSASSLIFYTTTLITMALFFKVAIKWPALVQHIAATEKINPLYNTKLVNKCNITCVVVLCLALLEHILSVVSAFAGGLNCFPEDDVYQGFVKHSYPWVFNFIPYFLPLGIVTQFLHFQSTFIWNFSDLFVICISYYLASRLEQLNTKLLAAQGKYLPEVFWRATREDYCRVTQLVRQVDGVISGVIFISFANNLFFVCLQLFNSLENGIGGSVECDMKPKMGLKSYIFGGYESTAYFIFSLSFLIGRSIAVSLIASQVNSASNIPAPVLYDVPSPVYCVEVQRFLDQVNGDKVALSGLQFFVVTRGLLLTVAGTIVTYELVMVQFNSPSSSSGDPNGTTMLPLLATTPT